jgi:GNAT superfamily N-acetyltransferase
MASPELLEITIEPVTSPDNFPVDFVEVERKAFATIGGDIFSAPKDAADAVPMAEAQALRAKSYGDILRNDPSVRYYAAKLPSGQIIGIAKWIFFAAGPEPPPAPIPAGTNIELMTWFSARMRDERRKVLGGKRHVRMAALAVDPEYHRKGVGGKLLEVGLRQCDEEELACWIDASQTGKGLYLKHDWVVVSTFDIEPSLVPAEKRGGPILPTACMIRQPQPLKAVS